MVCISSSKIPKRTRMRSVWVSLLFIVVLASCATFENIAIRDRQPANASIDISKIENRLRSFESDGCSKFANGIPYPKEEKWGLCCVQHDIAYWKGGTSEERYQADQRLQSCIIGVGEPNIARLVYWGVRAGGSAGNSSNWNWGYGWVLSRGYAPFSENEKKQVQSMESEVPEDISKIPIGATSKVIRSKDTLTGNYCLDSSIIFIQNNLSRQMTPLSAYESESEVSSGLEYKISIMTKECFKPYVFTYVLRKKDSCTRKLNELQFRLEVSLKDIDYPQECQ